MLSCLSLSGCNKVVSTETFTDKVKVIKAENNCSTYYINGYLYIITSYDTEVVYENNTYTLDSCSNYNIAKNHLNEMVDAKIVINHFEDNSVSTEIDSLIQEGK